MYCNLNTLKNYIIFLLIKINCTTGLALLFPLYKCYKGETTFTDASGGNFILFARGFHFVTN